MAEKADQPKPNEPANIMDTQNEKPGWEKEIVKKADFDAFKNEIKNDVKSMGDSLMNLLKAKPEPEPKKESEAKPNPEPTTTKEVDLFGFEI